MFTDFAIPISQSAIVCATNVPCDPISIAEPGPEISQNASYSFTKLWHANWDVFVTPVSNIAIVTFAPVFSELGVSIASKYHLSPWYDWNE